MWLKDQKPGVKEGNVADVEREKNPEVKEEKKHEGKWVCPTISSVLSVRLGLLDLAQHMTVKNPSNRKNRWFLSAAGNDLPHSLRWSLLSVQPSNLWVFVGNSLSLCCFLSNTNTKSQAQERTASCAQPNCVHAKAITLATQFLLWLIVSHVVGQYQLQCMKENVLFDCKNTPMVNSSSK